MKFLLLEKSMGTKTHPTLKVVNLSDGVDVEMIWNETSQIVRGWPIEQSELPKPEYFSL